MTSTSPVPSRTYTSALYGEEEPPDAHPSTANREPHLTPEDRSLAAAKDKLPALLTSKQWRLTPDGAGIEKEFCFKGFKRGAWRFMADVAHAVNAANHHPTWTNTYNKVNVLWTTHRPQGLSWRDVQLAEQCEEIAERIWEEERQGGGAKKGQAAP